MEVLFRVFVKHSEEHDLKTKLPGVKKYLKLDISVEQTEYLLIS